MTNQAANIKTQQPELPAGEFLGHPKALWYLSNIEMWERFSFFGMRAILAVYVATTFFGDLGAGANAKAALVYGGYAALVYSTGIVGGYVADHILGYQRSILLGALIMASGLLILLIEDLDWFLVGLALLVAGNGLFKPNMSTMIGKLYAPGDVRRDSGFTIFYMGVNIGAFIAPLVTASWIGVTWGLKYGFLAAGIGMILATLFLEIAKKPLGHVGMPNEGKEGWGWFFGIGLGAIALAAVVFFLLSESTFLGFLLFNILAFLVVYFFSGSSARAGAAIGLAIIIWLVVHSYAMADGSEADFAMIPFIQYLRSHALDHHSMMYWGFVVVVAAFMFGAQQIFYGNKVQVQRYIAMMILFLANTCFWALAEQAGISLAFFAREFVTPIHFNIEPTALFGREVIGQFELGFSRVSWQDGGFGILQSLNGLYILILAPFFAMLWPKLDSMGVNPSIPRKFALALIQVALGFYVLVFAIANMQNAFGLVPWIFLALCYLLHTTGELCMSPIGLSMVTKLADEKETGLAMGGWFLSIAMAQYLAGLIAAIASGGRGGGAHAVRTAADIGQYQEVYMQLFWLGLAFGLVFLLLAPAINKLMHGVK